MSERYLPVTSTFVVLPADNVDTDQIIPARFLKTTDKRGLGASLFADWQGPDFPLCRDDARGAQILVAGENFGCGSSREHAPWALVGFGFRAIVAKSFADIFRGNALKNGLLPIAIDDATHGAIVDARARDPKAKLAIDLAKQTLTLPDGSRLAFEIDPFSKECLLSGVDELGYLLARLPEIERYENRAL